jgi:hypothetical protein
VRIGLLAAGGAFVAFGIITRVVADHSDAALLARAQRVNATVSGVPSTPVCYSNYPYGSTCQDGEVVLSFTLDGKPEVGAASYIRHSYHLGERVAVLDDVGRGTLYLVPEGNPYHEATAIYVAVPLGLLALAAGLLHFPAVRGPALRAMRRVVRH